jgi:hypothetical protein
MVTVSQSKLLKKRSHINITCKSAIYLYMLIQQAGDIQIQPDPTYIKYPCGICNKNVNLNDKALQCDGDHSASYVLLVCMISMLLI